jgi:hypothetical protein
MSTKTKLPKTDMRALVEWTHGGDTGISSKTIAAVMTGAFPGLVHDGDNHPHDCGDFGRCYRLLKTQPTWRKRLSLMSGQSPQWAGLVRAWPKLEALYEKAIVEKLRWSDELYAAMKKAQGRR